MLLKYLKSATEIDLSFDRLKTWKSWVLSLSYSLSPSLHFLSLSLPSPKLCRNINKRPHNFSPSYSKFFWIPPRKKDSYRYKSKILHCLISVCICICIWWYQTKADFGKEQTCSIHILWLLCLISMAACNSFLISQRGATGIKYAKNYGSVSLRKVFWLSWKN